MRLFAGWLYFCGIVGMVVAVLLYVLHQPMAPDKDDLVQYTGFLKAIRLEQDFDGTHIVLLHFRDNEQAYKYISDYPMYVDVRDRMGIYRDADVWYDKNAAGGPDTPILVWAIAEHDPRGPEESTVVTFEEIYEEVTETDRSWQNVSMIMAAGALGFILIGFLIRRLFPYKPREPHV